MRKRVTGTIISAALFVYLFSLRFAHASILGGPVTLPNPISATSFTQVTTNVTNFLIQIAVPLTAIMALVGGFQMITAGGDPEKFSKGRKTLMYAAIGFAVVVLAGGVAAIIRNFLGTS
jgi:hypothetical protein